MIYVVGTESSGYNVAHFDSLTGLSIARGLRACGATACVAWGGAAGEVRGVPHVPLADLAPTECDVLFVALGQLAKTLVEKRDVWARLRSAGERWVYTQVEYDRFDHVWSEFDTIFVESPNEFRRVRAKHRDKRVGWLMAGAVDEITLASDSPYPSWGKHLFYAGRAGRFDGPKGESALEQFSRLLGHLPRDYHLWYMTSFVGVPRSQAAIPPSYSGKWMATHCDGVAKPWLLDGDVFHVPNSAFRSVCDALGANPRLHCLGAAPYGTFWEHFHHAHATLDRGFATAGAPINFKILDPLRSGGRVVADGESPSYYLLDRYGQSRVAAGDLVAMARAIVSLHDEPAPVRLQRAELVRAQEGWARRARDLLDFVGWPSTAEARL